MHNPRRDFNGITGNGLSCGMTQAPPANAWSHLVFTRSGGSGAIFLNGAQVGSCSCAAAQCVTHSRQTYLGIGRDQMDGNSYYSGRVAQFIPLLCSRYLAGRLAACWPAGPSSTLSL